MKRYIYLTCLILVGAINFLPALGLLSAENLQQAYDITLEDPNLIILMRHRALLFGLIGGLVFYSLWKPHLRTTALTLAGISMMGFLLLMAHEAEFNRALIRIAGFDLVGIISLTIAVMMRRGDRFSEY